MYRKICLFREKNQDVGFIIDRFCDFAHVSSSTS